MAPRFGFMTKKKLRRWVQANPTRVNDRDGRAQTPLHAAAGSLDSLSLVLWLLDEKGADLNVQDHIGDTPLHLTDSRKIITALLDHGADSSLLRDITLTPLMWHAYDGKVACLKRLLQDPRVRATVDFQGEGGDTALPDACTLEGYTKKKPAMIRHLLQAGANPFLTNKQGLTPLALLQQQWPSYRGAIALLGQAPEAEKASLLVKARRLFVTSTSNAAPSCLQGRVVRGQPLPRVVLPQDAAPSQGEGWPL